MNIHDRCLQIEQEQIEEMTQLRKKVLELDWKCQELQREKEQFENLYINTKFEIATLKDIKKNNDWCWEFINFLEDNVPDFDDYCHKFNRREK